VQPGDLIRMIPWTIDESPHSLKMKIPVLLTLFVFTGGALESTRSLLMRLRL
jgi:hypothetical protein